MNFESPELLDLCRRWKVRELALFGSVLREDFAPESDIDVLVTFESEAPWTLWDLMEMTEELSKLWGRAVDLVEAEGLRNPFRRRSILNSKHVLYAA